jgi:polyhydroxybutyrate depolymerase
MRRAARFLRRRIVTLKRSPFAILTLDLCSALASPACRTETREAPYVEPRTGRGYRLVARGDHDPHRPAPVLFALHPYATHPDVLVESYALVKHAVLARRWLLVIPEGKLDGAHQYAWNASAACCGIGARPDDLGYLRAVLADVERHFAVDRARVYALGVSNGAFMAQRWAGTPGGDLRAIVSVAGAGSGPDDPPCAPSVPVSVLQIHGTRDERIRYEGGTGERGRYPSVPETVRVWSGLARARGAPAERVHRSLHFEKVREQRWQGESATVELWTVEGGDHALGALRFEVPAILDFLEQNTAQIPAPKGTP